MRHFRSWIVVIAITMTTFATNADTITLLNGDTITGAISAVDANNVAIKHPSLGDLTIPVANIHSYTRGEERVVLNALPDAVKPAPKPEPKPDPVKPEPPKRKTAKDCPGPRPCKTHSSSHFPYPLLSSDSLSCWMLIKVA